VRRDYISIGIRSGAKEEYNFARQNGVRFYTTEQVKEEGIDAIVRDVLDYLNTERVYISIDADAIDPGYAPAVGTPEPFGMTPSDVRTVIKNLAPLAVGFDIVEITPDYDHGETALLGTRLIREFIMAKSWSR
jgi:agmatinase